MSDLNGQPEQPQEPLEPLQPQESQVPGGPAGGWPGAPEGDPAAAWATGTPYGSTPPHGNWHQTPGWGSPVPPAPRVRRRRYARPAAAVLLAAGTMGATAAITHAVWPSSVRDLSASSSSPSSSGGSGAGNGSSTPDFPGAFGDEPSGGDSPFSGGSGGAAGTGSTEGSGGPADVSSIAAKVSPALVDINTTFGYQGAEGAGTGIVISSDGEILTNNHVIDGATSIRVTDIGNGHTYRATVVGYDATADVAVLKLQGATGLQTANLADSSAVTVGQQVVAVGNAGGQGGTPSAAGGSVTALNRSITASDQLDGTSEHLKGLIETNANVQEGDSGGSLVNTAGQVIGMDTAASTGFAFQSSYSAQGYAIPINTAMSIASQIQSGQPSSTVHVGPTAFLGVMISSSSGGGSASFANPYGDGGSSGGTGAAGVTGAPVAGVVPGGAAATAGLARGDVITGVDGQTVTSPTDLSGAISRDTPGQTIRITWTDLSGSTHSTTVTLKAGPPA